MRKIFFAILVLSSVAAVSQTNSQSVGVPNWNLYYGNPIFYKSNYGSLFTTRSLPDKNYVDSSLLATGGAYVPTITNVTNMSSITADSAFWSRSGNIVTVYGHFTATMTSSSTNEADISLPVASHFGSKSCWGVGSTNAPPGSSSIVAIFADVTNIKAEVVINPGTVSGTPDIYYSFSYIVQ